LSFGIVFSLWLLPPHMGRVGVGEFLPPKFPRWGTLARWLKESYYKARKDKRDFISEEEVEGVEEKTFKFKK